MIDRHGPKYYVLDGHEPVPVDDVLTWAKWFETARQDRVVKQTKIGDVEVSTVFLGHQYHTDWPPLIFETMTFGGPLDGSQTRCSTWSEAEQQHADACHEARSPAEDRGGERG